MSSQVQQASAALFGANPLEGIVGCDVRDAHRGAPCQAVVYQRTGDTVKEHLFPFRPWLLSAEKPSEPAVNVTRLTGEGLCWLCEFDSFDAFFTARSALRDRGLRSMHDYIAFPSFVRQFLVRSGITWFKGLSFDDVLRLQLDIETTTLSPRHPEAAVLMVALCSNQGFRQVLVGEEPELFRNLNTLIQDLNPDVIEGHNLLGFDIPYLHARALAHNIRLTWGRDGSQLRLSERRSYTLSGYSRPFHQAQVFGRSLIDTLMGVQRYDVGRGELTSLGLKEVARQLGIAEPGRVYLDRAQMQKLFEEEPERVSEYALQDVCETASLASIVMPPEFYVSQMAPDSYQANATGGTGEKINLLMIREYLRQGQAIPLPRTGRPVIGGYTDIRRTGLIEPVVKCDVESLYPSLMLARKIAPATDHLGVFLPMLRELTTRRLQAKANKARAAGSERTYWDGLQASFKILINSFYGYLGAGFFFNDPDAAEQVTTGGQEIIRKVVRELEDRGASVVEVDTDGVYFQPPADVETLDDEQRLISEISALLPEGINLAHDGRWRAMLSLKVKNYVLIGYDERRIYRGAALRSRADERFGRQFVAQAIDLIAAGDMDSISGIYMEYLQKIESGELNVEEFCRRERITSKALEGRSLQRAGQAIARSAPGEYVRLYRRSDGTLARVQDYDSDEDREFLCDKLYKFAQRLRPVLGDEFDRICPHPRKHSQARRSGQQSLDLFD